MAIVEVKKLSFTYPDIERDTASLERNHPVLDQVSLSVEEGAFCVIVGATGCGKTTLLRTMKPELMPVGTKTGTVRICGKDIIVDGVITGAMDGVTSASSIGYVMQDPAAQIVCDTVWHELAFGLENLGTNQDVMRRRIAEVAHFFGIEPWVRAETETLSGGQKQLVNLAAVLALRPRVLLLDEPTAQLDPHAVKQFLFMLARVNKELGITIIMATHSPEDVEMYATQYVVLDEMCPCGTKTDAQAAARPRLEARADMLQSKPYCLQVKGAYYRYERQEPWILRAMDVNIREGSVHALVGGNGCGKSTLLKVMAGIAKPQRGSVKNTLAHSQALLPQSPKSLFVCDSVEEEIAEWRDIAGFTHDDELDMLARFDLTSHMYQHPYDLSGGQQQKLAVAKLLLCRPRILFLDEPTKGLDPRSCSDVVRIVKDLADEGVTIVLVTHDLDFAFVTADMVSMIFDGEIACTEPCQSFFMHNLVYRPNDKSRLYGAL